MPAASFGGLVGVLVHILVIFQCKCPVVAVGTVECIAGSLHSWFFHITPSGDCRAAVGALNADPSTQFNFVCAGGEKKNVLYLGGSSETDCKTNAQAMNTLAADASVTCDSYFGMGHYERVHCTRNCGAMEEKCCGAMEEKCNTHAEALNQIITPTTATTTIATTTATAALTTTAVASTTTITTTKTVPSATCTCQDEWGFNGATYNGCAFEPSDPESWCYTTAECSTSNPSEKKTGEHWSYCTLSTATTTTTTRTEASTTKTATTTTTSTTTTSTTTTSTTTTSTTTTTASTTMATREGTTATTTTTTAPLATTAAATSVTVTATAPAAAPTAAASTPPTLLATAIIDATNETTRILGTLNGTAATTATTAIAAGALSFGGGNATNDAITDAASRLSNGVVALIVIAVLLCIVGVFLGRRYLQQGKNAGTGTDNNNGLQSPPNQQPGAAGFRGPSDVHHNSAFN
eukprot:gene26044-27716_t